MIICYTTHINYGSENKKMKQLKIDFALLTIISLLACYMDKWFGIFEIKNDIWKTIIIILFTLFVITAILEKVQIIINNRKDNNRD